jgi:NAD(P)-dependent dehydrogenase (short-subunit alcohol dehydrogenase family)
MKALVTGVSRGIGRAICIRLAQDALKRGETPHIVATATGKSADLEDTIAELKALGAKAHAITGDLTDADDPVRIATEAIDFCGGLDALVNNAGFPVVGTLLDVKLRHWDKMFAINCRSTLLLGRTAYAALSQSKGAIIAISSTAGQMPAPGLTGYSPSKGALVNLIKQMAYEWGPDGIRSNCVSPGSTQSRSTELAFTAEGMERRAKPIPLRRVGRAQDIAGAVAFLAGPDGVYVNGVDLTVDGGQRLITMDAALPRDRDYTGDRGG